MSMEIKFRAWDKEYKCDVLVDALLLHRLKREVILRDDIHGVFKRKIADVELRQYTGLKDKNGVEIYERDIVKLLELNEVGKIERLDAAYVFKFDDTCYRYLHQMLHLTIEVIGNIYENKELLDGK